MMLYIAQCKELNVVRGSLNRHAFKDIDGETLLGLERDDLIELGVKRIHVKKFLRIIEELKVGMENDDLANSLSRGALFPTFTEYLAAQKCINSHISTPNMVCYLSLITGICLNFDEFVSFLPY